MGNRPSLWTNARRYAPVGARELGEMLERFGFADFATVVLDWSNETGLQPEEAYKPVIIVDTFRHVGHRTLTVRVRLDVEDLFGNDEVTADMLLDVVSDMEKKTLSELERK